MKISECTKIPENTPTKMYYSYSPVFELRVYPLLQTPIRPLLEI